LQITPYHRLIHYYINKNTQNTFQQETHTSIKRHPSSGDDDDDDSITSKPEFDSESEIDSDESNPESPPRKKRAVISDSHAQSKTPIRIKQKYQHKNNDISQQSDGELTPVTSQIQNQS
jgi:hypothetical protein